MRVLVVEDEPKLGLALKQALELQRYAVDLATDGQDGFDLASVESYDILILDVMIPSLSGIELCQKLRQNRVTTPILLLTARDQIHDKISGLDAGADDYMVKPFSLEELFSRLRALLRRPSADLPNTLRAGPIELDTVTFSTTLNGKLLSLSQKEFCILEYLLKHKNKVVTKEELLQHVWNFDADVLPSTVEVHIKNLRHKIDSNNSRSLITTVRGFGYTIKE